jgi:PAS domain S-box-containing protein
VDRIRAGQALAQSELRYRTLLETAFDWVWEVDASGRSTYSSPRVRDLLGYEPGEVVGRTVFELMPEAEAVRMEKLFRDIVLEQQPFSNLENVCRHKNGSLVTMETSGAPVFGEGGEETEAEAEGRSLPRGKETILLVEDDTRVRQMVAQSLRSLGYRVHEARTGSEAIQWWPGRGAEADLLFTDMVMPGGMTGLELALELRSFRPGLRVLISSGYSAEFSQGVNPVDQGFDYLPKPYELDKLAHAVRGCFDRR